MFSDKEVKIIEGGGVGVIPTDTLYGIVCSALNRKAVGKVSKLKKRSDGKGYIVLVSSIDELASFGVEVSEKARIFLRKFWPGKVSIILTSILKEFDYIQKDGAIAFRIPDKDDLRLFLSKTGPLIAPSANTEGDLPARDIMEAKKYFESEVDFYIDQGILISEPSTIVKMVGDKVEIIRQGVVNVSIDNI